jgi:hypothetical protein
MYIVGARARVCVSERVCVFVCVAVSDASTAIAGRIICIPRFLCLCVLFFGLLDIVFKGSVTAVEEAWKVAMLL